MLNWNQIFLQSLNSIIGIEAESFVEQNVSMEDKENLEKLIVPR